MLDGGSIDLGGINLKDAADDARLQTLYLRKLSKQSDWGHITDQLDDRAESAATAVFRPEDSAFSLYQVGSLLDLRRVISGMAANRANPIQNIDVVAFTHTELVSAGIKILSDVLGELGCVAANQRHVDIESESRKSFATLCRRAMNDGRAVRRFRKKSEVSAIVAAQEQYGCEAFPGNKACPCY